MGGTQSWWEGEARLVGQKELIGSSGNTENRWGVLERLGTDGYKDKELLPINHVGVNTMAFLEGELVCFFNIGNYTQKNVLKVV